MQITIDTQKDSPEDIRKVVALLSSMADKNYSRVRKPSKNIFDDPTLEISSESSQKAQQTGSSESSSNAFANMFGSSASSSASQSASDYEPKVEEEKAEEGIEIIPY